LRKGCGKLRKGKGVSRAKWERRADPAKSNAGGRGGSPRGELWRGGEVYFGSIISRKKEKEWPLPEKGKGSDVKNVTAKRSRQDQGEQFKSRTEGGKKQPS